MLRDDERAQQLNRERFSETEAAGAALVRSPAGVDGSDRGRRSA
jgi:hypothetical protein